MFLCKILDFVSFLAKLIIHPQFLGRILPSSISWEDQFYFLGFLARTISLLRSFGKILSSSVSWEDQLYFLRRLLATSFSFSRFSWKDLRHFHFFGKIPDFSARYYTCWIVWQDLILPEFHGKILDFFSFLAIIIILLQFLGRTLPPSVSWEDQFNFLGLLSRSHTSSVFS